MACNLITNSSNQIVGVENKDGNYSQVFQQILNNPHVQGGEDAVKIYSNIFDNEQPITYKNENGEEFGSFKQALDATSKGDISAVSGSVNLFKVNSTTDISNFTGLVNNLVKAGTISDETVTDTDGKKLYKPAGNSEYKQLITSDSAINTARSSVGYAVKRDKAGNLYFDMNAVGKREILNKKGEVEYLTQEQLDKKDFRQTSDPEGILAERAYKENNRAFGDKQALEELEIIPKNKLQERLLTLLKDLGVSTVSLNSYSEKYNSGASALADIANKLIAFKDGIITSEDLSEETAHFIVEATSPQELEDILRNIDKTQEWQQFEQTYREIYGQQYSGQELENIVRKEILGKVLANSFQDNFAKDKVSDTNNSIISRIQDIFNNFIAKIRAYFKPIYQQQLDSYTKSVYANLMAGELYDQLDENELNGKKYVLYSIEQAGIPEEYKKLARALDHVTNQQYQLQKKYVAPANQNMLKEAKESILNSIESLDEDIKNISKLKALSNITTVATGQLNYLTSAIDKNAKNGHTFAQEETSVFQNFTTKVEPLLAQLNGQLSSKIPYEKVIKDKIDALLKKAAELKGKIPDNTNAVIKALAERVIKKNNLTGAEADKYRAQIENVLTAAQKDTGWFHAHLGQLVHAQNSLLNLMGDVIARTHTEERQLFIPRFKQFINEIEASGFNLQSLKKLIGKDGYILNESDDTKIKAEDLKDQKGAYEAVTGQVVSDFTPSMIEALSTSDKSIFDKALTLKKKERLESFYTQEHLDKLNNAFITVNGVDIKRSELPEIALEFEQEYKGQIAQIRINNGGINTLGDKAQIEELSAQRAQNSSPYYLDGSLKKGLKEEYDEELGQYVISLQDSARSLSDDDYLEAQKVYGLQMLSLINRKFYSDNQTVREGIPQLFTDKLNEFETEQEKWDFVTSNAYVGFKQDFWDNFGQNESLRERLQNAKDGENDEEIDDIIENIREKQRAISNILKGRRVFNQPSETNVSAMETVETSAIKDATIQLENLYSKANTFLPKDEQVSEPFSENRANDSFTKDLEDENVVGDNAKLNFILKHVTPNSKNAIDKAAKVANIIANGEMPQISKSLQNVFREDMPAEEAQTALMNYAESKLLPYYKRTEPIGYSQEKQQLQDGIKNNEAGTVEKYLKESQFTDISPSYSFYNQSEAINPKWLANRDAKRPQYTQAFLDRVRNEGYYSRYGIDANGNPTSNLQEWKAREALLSLQDWSIENYNLTGQHNRYQLPQHHKSGIKRLQSFFTNFDPKTIKEGISDFANFREDEEGAGQDAFGNRVSNSAPILSIPIYGIKQLENQKDVSDELLHSYGWMAQQSALHKARRANISDMLAIQSAVLNSDYVGKAAEATNAVKMMKSFLNSNFYGVSESFNYEISLKNGKKVNLGKLAKVFNNWVRMVNLTGVVVPLTSLFQASVQKSIEDRIGETVNTIAASLADKEFRRTASGAAGEIMKLTSKSKLNSIMEAFGVSSVTERYENSSYGRGIRTLLGSAHGLHSLGNFPVIPRVALTVLHDYRYTNGKLSTLNQFIRENAGKDKKQVIEDYKKLPLFYDDIVVKDGIQSYNRESIAQKTGLEGQQLDELITNAHEFLSGRIGAAVQDIDSQIKPEERSIAARDARASFLLMHSNWFTLAWQKKTKSYGYDTARDIFTEGSWSTTFNFLQDMVLKRKNIKEAYRETMADPLKRRNLNRTMLELGVANSLAIAAILLAKYVDDDDDPLWPVAFADYMLTRLTNEQISSTVALPRQFSESIQNPIIAFQKFTDLANVFDLLSSEKVQSGSYAGETERYRWAAKNLPALKDLNRLADPKKAAQSLRYFNQDVLDWAAASWFFQPDEDENK